MKLLNTLMPSNQVIYPLNTLLPTAFFFQLLLRSADTSAKRKSSALEPLRSALTPIMLQVTAEQAQFNPLLNRIDLLVGHEDLNQYHWSLV